jgi:hypothetical protein
MIAKPTALIVATLLTLGTWRADAAPSATPPLPDPPRPTRGAPSEADVKATEPAAIELAKRADAGDKAFVAKLMPGASDDAVVDMIDRIKRADVRKTWKAHLQVRSPESAGLNYHDPSHFQVDLTKDGQGRWEVARLWFCR